MSQDHDDGHEVAPYPYAPMNPVFQRNRLNRYAALRRNHERDQLAEFTQRRASEDPSLTEDTGSLTPSGSSGSSVG